MTDNPDRSSIYAAMSEVEDEDQAARAARNPFVRQTDNTITVSVPGGGTAEVPSTAYVRELERTVRAQADVIAKFERQFHRIAATLRKHRSTINGQVGKLNDVNRDLDQKIDRRD